jgi:hypothetical protein
MIIIEKLLEKEEEEYSPLHDWIHHAKLCVVHNIIIS